MDRGARWAIVHRVTKGQTQLKQLSTRAQEQQKQNQNSIICTLLSNTVKLGRAI